MPHYNLSISETRISLFALLLILISTPLRASPLYFQTQFGVATESDFGEALVLIYERPISNTNVLVVSSGKQFADNLFGWPAEVVAYGSVQYFGERGLQPDIIGTTVYIKAYKTYKFSSQQIPVRLGLGEGLSYVSRIPFIEVEDFAPGRSAKLTNYLEWSVQTSLSYLMGKTQGRYSQHIKDVYIGYSVFHRSTVFGLFAQTGGGINYMGIGIELIFD